MPPRFRRGVTLTNIVASGVRRVRMLEVRSFLLVSPPDRTEVLRSGPRFISAIPSTAQAVHILRRPKWQNCSVRLEGLKRNPPSPLRPESTRLAIVLLFTTGMRRGELLKLTFGDYDRQEATLHIRETKFYKSRLLPINAQIADEIERYLRARSPAKRLPFPGHATHVECDQGGRAYTGTGCDTVCSPAREMRHHHAEGEAAADPGSSAQLRCECPAALVPSRRRCRG